MMTESGKKQIARKVNEQWDDSVIIRAFEDAVRNHRTRTTEKEVALHALEDDIHLSTSSSAKKRVSLIPDITDDGSKEKRRKMKEKSSESVSDEWGNSNGPSHVPNKSLHNNLKDLINEEREADSGCTSTLNSVDVTTLDQQALNEMLMAWYRSGYTTGRYHAIQEFKSILSDRQPSHNDHMK